MSSPRLLDRVRTEIRTRHYSRRTEQAYVHWIRRFIVFHGKKHPSTMGAPEISEYLAWLATNRRVAASTQNQALSAVLFLYRDVLRLDVGDIEQVSRARGPARVPVVLSVDEVRRVLKELIGLPGLVAALLYGAGLRLQECLELRVKDLDFERREVVVRRGKGQKDRRVMLPDAVRDRLGQHLEAVRRQHHADLALGLGRVVLPDALDRKFPNAAAEWRWAVRLSRRADLPRSTLGTALAISRARVSHPESRRQRGEAGSRLSEGSLQAIADGLSKIGTQQVTMKDLKKPQE